MMQAFFFPHDWSMRACASRRSELRLSFGGIPSEHTSVVNATPTDMRTDRRTRLGRLDVGGPAASGAGPAGNPVAMSILLVEERNK
jgi:hypothetical protein